MDIKRNIKNVTSKLEITTIIVSCCFIVFMIGEVVFQTGFSWIVDFEKSSVLGDSLAGIFSFVSVILIVISLNKQSSSFLSSKIESRFFELLKLHRENVQEFEYSSPESKEKDQIIRRGHQVFVSIYFEILLSLKYLDRFMSNKKNNKITDYYKEKAMDSRKNKLLPGRDYELDELERINVAYLVVFLGVSNQGKKILRSCLCQIFSENFVDEMIDYYEWIPVRWSKYRNCFDKEEGFPVKAKFMKYFGGHQHRLGHYFRHLYQTVTYIDKIKTLTYQEKYEYIKTLRAQLSTHEQAVIFFNSLSDFGRVWELENKDPNKQLVTKFNLIKNMHAEFISLPKIGNYYPFVEYEGTIVPERNSLEEQYL